ncbi:MAG: sulfurtransferase TusA family protein [Devosiaceae bacterium]|nr:sulfurtransferase TusA family protein [Devosiaceae bacterium MH13]
MTQASERGRTEIDCIGLKCPLPVLRARKALRLAQPGTEIVVLSSDPIALVDVPHMVREDGHALVSQSVEDGIARFVIRA